MKFYLSLFTLLLFPSLSLLSQSIERQVFASSGMSYTLADITIGEVLTASFSNSSYTFSQGFQQGALIDVSIAQAQANDALSIFPNPTRTGFYLKTGASWTSPQITILNLQGEIVRLCGSYSSGTEILIADLAAGSYIIRVSSADNIQHQNHLLIKL